MFPYVEQPVFTIGGATIHAFGILASMAVVTGVFVVTRRAPRLGLDPEETFSLTIWTIAWGIVGSHLFAVIAYEPATLLSDPLELVRVWGSMSSFGGIMGGLLGAWGVMRWRRMSAADGLRFLDVVAFAFPFAWIFGRTGCALAHDHLGVRSDHWLAVRFPDGPRFDLGLLELLYTLVVAAAFVVLDRRPRPVGFFLGAFFLAYGPVRFALDFLRIGDARYLGWVPSQYLSLVATAAGAAILWRVTTAKR